MVCETVPSTWPDHGTGNVAVYCFHFISRCYQFQGLYSHKQKEIISISHQFKMIAELIFCHMI